MFGLWPNTCKLWKVHNWTGLLLDLNMENRGINLHKHALFRNNVVSIFEKYKFPKDLDFLSSDMGNDMESLAMPDSMSF